jgi:ubiquinone/menaquinone biosynthesis C-methylase UbiE
MKTMLHRRDEVMDLIRRHWDAKAGTFDDEMGHGVHSMEQRAAWLELLAKIAGPTSLRVLDAGCGTGILSVLLAELGHRVTGVDLAEQMLAVARRKAAETGRNVELRLGNVAQLGDPDCTYDLVIARHVLWALPDPSCGTKEWLRVLKPGGRLALIEGKWGRDDSNEPQSEIFRSLLWSATDAVLAVASYMRGGKRSRFYMRKYRRVEKALPFSGGPTADQLVRFLKAHGVAAVTIEPLMNTTLWGEVPQFPRYLAMGRRP